MTKGGLDMRMSEKELDKARKRLAGMSKQEQSAEVSRLIAEMMDPTDDWTLEHTPDRKLTPFQRRIKGIRSAGRLRGEDLQVMINCRG